MVVRTIVAVSMLSAVTWAQQPPEEKSPQQPIPPPRHAQKWNPPRGDRHEHPPGFFKRLRELPPDEQERVMANDERFQRLPRERQAEIRKNLRHWNSLTPQQKQATRERQEILGSLPPEKRAEARALFPRYNRLPPGRKQAVTQAFMRLANLPPAQRERFLSSPQLENRFSPEERDLLRGLSGLLPQ
jgi:hypothetical protein